MLIKDELRVKAKEWWSNRALRERQWIFFGSSFAVIFMTYQFLWMPLMNHVTGMRDNISKNQKMLVWMQAADKEIQDTNSNPKRKPTTAIVLLGLLQKQISQAGLEQNLTQLKQASNDTIAMRFQKVDFDKLIKLLSVMLKEENVSVTQMSAMADTTPGIVNTDIILKLV